MSYDKAGASGILDAQELIGAVSTILVNVTPYLMVNVLFGMDSSISGGGMAS